MGGRRDFASIPTAFDTEPEPVTVCSNRPMLERRSLKAPITLGVVMILVVVALTIGWIVVNIVLATKSQATAPLYYVVLAVGSVGLAVVLAGVIAYLTLTVKAINLNRRQSNFIDSVTHELKSPIASLKLYLQTLSRRNVDAEQRENFHRFMLEDVERLDQLINHLLDAARIERDSKPAPVEELRLDEVLRKGAIAANARYNTPGDTIAIECPPIVLKSRAIELDILFRNLIDNAVKYGGNPPSVKITAAASKDDRVLVRVADNGPGIPPNLRRKIFGRFVRLGSELERSKPGTGLGLYLVRTVTRSLGGSIHIDSPDHHVGTVFTVTLPGLVSIGSAGDDPTRQMPNGIGDQVDADKIGDPAKVTAAVTASVPTTDNPLGKPK